MKKVLLILVGILIGITATLIVQKIWMHRRLKNITQNQELQLPNVVKNLINRNLKGARFLDVTWSNSTANVNYAYDKLYDIHVSYERNNQIKRFTTQLGTSGIVWITPNASELEILDDEGEIIHGRSRNPRKKSVQGRNPS